MHNVLKFAVEEKAITRKKQGYGWNITFWDEIMERIEDESDWGGYHDHFSVRDDLVFPNRQEAEAYIEDNFCGYSDGAVKYKEAVLSEAQKKKLADMDTKIQELREAIASKALYNKYLVGLSSKYTSCAGCGSKLSVEHIVRHHMTSCPLCNACLLPKSMQNRYEKQKTTLNDAIKKKQAFENDGAKKHSKIKWLVKIEYHS